MLQITQGLLEEQELGSGILELSGPPNLREQCLPRLCDCMGVAMGLTKDKSHTGPQQQGGFLGSVGAKGTCSSPPFPSAWQPLLTTVCKADEVSAFLTDADTCSTLPGAPHCSHCRVPSMAQGGQGSAALTVL